MKNKRPSLLALALDCTLALSSVAHAAGPSETASRGLGSIAASPLASVEGGPLAASAFFVVGASFVVIGVGAGVGEVVSVVVQSSVDGSKAVIKASSAIAREVGVSVGSGIKVIATSTGYALLASGKLLAFVPNAVGQELLYQSKLSK